MEDATHGHGVGSSLSMRVVVAMAVAAVAILGGLYLRHALRDDHGREEIVIATGLETGTYHALGGALARVLEDEGLVESAEVRPTDGSVQNMDLIGSAESGVDLAFVQSDTPPKQGARAVARLYDEVLHVLVSKVHANEIRTIFDLHGKRVSLGSRGSGTRQLSERVLAHFGLEVGEDLSLPPEEVAAGLTNGSVDAAFILTAIPSHQIAELAENDVIRFLPLGDGEDYGGEADALALVYPSVRSMVIPRGTYSRLPLKPVRTVNVSAMLIARRTLDEALVRDVTSAVFEYRADSSGLDEADLSVARKIREDYRPSEAVMPFHQGAVAYYNREEPGFFVKYAEALSLGLTLAVMLYSGSVAFREWMRRRMKNRIDAYLLEIDRRTTDLASLQLEQLIAHRDALDEVRHRAFSDLVNERLLADESFTIFQNHLRDEFTAIEARITEQMGQVERLP